MPEEIQWSSDAPDIVSISGDQDGALLEALSAGMAIITARVTTENGTFEKNLTVYTRTDPESMVYASEEMPKGAGESDVPDLNARAVGDVTITFDGQERVNYTSMDVNDTREVKIYVEGETIQSIQWESDNTGVISIAGDKDGAFLEAKSVGVATITANITTNSGNVTKDVMISTRSVLDNMTGYANADADMHRAANESSSISRTISKNEVLEIRGENGNYYFVYYDADADSAFGFILKTKINIPANGLALDKEYITIKKGGQETIHVEVSPSLYTGTVTWNSNKAAVAAVSNNGKVTGVKEGAAKIQAKAEGINGDIQAACMVSVWTELTEAAAVTSGTVSGKMGALPDAADTGSVVKGTSVTVIGQCGDYYYVKLADGSKVFLEKSVIIIPVKGISLASQNITIEVGQSYQLTAKILPEVATDKRVSWSSSNSNVTKVDANGKITGVKKGTAYIEARTSDGNMVAECKVNVRKNQVSEASPGNEVEIRRVDTGYQSAIVHYRINGIAGNDITVYITFFDSATDKMVTQTQQSVPGNGDFNCTVGGLQYSKSYRIQVRIYYTEKNTRKSKVSYSTTIMTKTPTVSLSLNKIGKSQAKIKMYCHPNTYMIHLRSDLIQQEVLRHIKN